MTRSRGNDSQRSAWRYSLTSFLRKARPAPRRCCNKRATSRLYSFSHRMLPSRAVWLHSRCWLTWYEKPQG